MIHLPRTLTAATLACAALAAAAAADEAAARYRALLDKAAPSILTLRAVIRTEGSMMGRPIENEARQEISATVIDAGGLCMLSDAPFGSPPGMGAMGGEMRRSVVSMKAVVGNEEKEYDAFLVATDAERHLTFVQVEGLGDRTLAAIDFAGEAKPAVGDTLVTVTRMDKGYDYAPYFQTSRVAGEIKKPRAAWLTDGRAAMGLPVFTEAGAAVGVATTVDAGTDEEDGGGGGMNMGRIMRMLGGMGAAVGGPGFVLPASSVRAAISQAKPKAAEMLAERAKKAAEGEKGGAKGKEGF